MLACLHVNSGGNISPPIEGNRSDHVNAAFRASDTDNEANYLSIPIAFPGPEGVWHDPIGPYFHVDNKLYAITSRRLFGADGGDVEGKEVLLMDKSDFTDYIASIGRRIASVGRMTDLTLQRIDEIDKSIRKESSIQQIETRRIETNIGAQNLHLIILHDVNRELEDFRTELKGRWSDPKNRVIGSVVWSSHFGGDPCTQDLCVVELDKEKFINLISNILSLGPETDPESSERLICDAELAYPRFFEGLLTLQDILAANLLDYVEDDKGVRRVLTHGFAPNTIQVDTLTTLTRFLSYRGLAPFIDSELNDTLAFKDEPDCGSVIAKFVRLPIRGIHTETNVSEIVYPPLECVWPKVFQEFLGAELHFHEFHDFFAGITFDTKPPFELQVDVSFDEE